MQSRSNLTTDESSVLSEPADRFAGQVHLHLVLGWCYDEPERIGESAVVLSEGLIGRGLARPDDPASRLVFVQQRLGSGRPCPALLAKRLSRLHLLVKPAGDLQLEVECIGRSALFHNGVQVTRAVAKDGDLLSISGVLTLLVEARARAIPPPRFWPDSASFTFGAADPFGMIGETAVMWQLRERLAEAAASDGHVLLLGSSGVGKELAARAVHELSTRAPQKLVARSSVTLPPGIVDAELFGCAKNYPNAGSSARDGLIGASDGSTLFLDEIGELPQEQQAHLLRVLDAGEYQRLGESQVRHSNLRVVAATNRSLTALKQDFLARFVTRIELPSLNERRADIPLLIAAILSAQTRARPGALARFLPEAARIPRLSRTLLEQLIQHDYTGNFRELEYLLRLAISTSEDQFIEATPSVLQEIRRAEIDPPAATNLDRDKLKAALAEHRGSASEVAHALGLSSRFALYRLLKKFDLSFEDDERE